MYNLGVMEHFTGDQVRKVLREFHRVLAPDGTMILFWPHRFGSSVLFLKAVRVLLSAALGRDVKIHPDEPTLVRSSRQVEELLEDAGFALRDFSFGARDLFVCAVVVGRKNADSSPAREVERVV